MQKVKIEPFKVIGISVRTTNENGKSAKDIGALWERFYSEGIIEQIPNKLGTEILNIYTDYEGDFTNPYTTLLGCKVSSLDEIPKGLDGKSFEGGDYLKLTAQGDLNKGAVYEVWKKIWNTDLKRAYAADFEVYGEKAQNPVDAEVEIYLSVNDY